MKFRSIFFVLVSFVIFSCNGQTSENIKTVEAKTFAEKIKTTDNPQILDVRTPEEFNAGHIENANNVNWLGDSFVKDAEKYDKTKPVFVYCKSGGRSKKATEKLQELGFKNIYELDGGFMKWDAEGLSEK
jgi:rhodanese-related sulfurtransferase